MKNVTVIDHPLIRVRLATLRDEQTAPAQFRKAMRELAALMLPAILDDLPTRAEQIRTPLEECPAERLERRIAFVPVLRAALGMVDIMHDLVPEAVIGHIGIERDPETLRPRTYYCKLPAEIADADVVVVDPMLATGWSAVAAVEVLRQHGASRVRFVCLVSCPEGIARMASACPGVRVFTAAVDRELNGRGYILPGLGDAGDRYFGTGGSRTGQR